MPIDLKNMENKTNTNKDIEQLEKELLDNLNKNTENDDEDEKLDTDDEE